VSIKDIESHTSSVVKRLEIVSKTLIEDEQFQDNLPSQERRHEIKDTRNPNRVPLISSHEDNNNSNPDGGVIIRRMLPE
jgi:hypothetical protein